MELVQTIDIPECTHKLDSANYPPAYVWDCGLIVPCDVALSADPGVINLHTQGGMAAKVAHQLHHLLGHPRREALFHVHYELGRFIIYCDCGGA